jgi:hypothetical protein
MAEEQAKPVDRKGPAGSNAPADPLGAQIHAVAGHWDRVAREMVAREPGKAVLIALGVGFGLGLLVSAALAHRDDSRPQNWLPDSWRDLSEKIGEHVAQHVPKWGGSR